MNVRRSLASLMLVGAVAAPAVAQEEAPAYTVGAPQPGVTVPLRVSNPGDSQRILNVQAPEGGTTAPTVQGPAAPAPAGAAPAAPGAPAETKRIPYISPTFDDGTTPADQATDATVDPGNAYTGIVPGERDSLPHIARLQRSAESGKGPNQLTWLGFQPFETSTRIFIQTGRTADYGINRSGDGSEIRVRLRGTQVRVRNFFRPIDASAWGRSIQSVRAERAGSDVEIVIAVKAGSNYTVKQEGGYLYLDFAEGGAR